MKKKNRKTNSHLWFFLRISMSSNQTYGSKTRQHPQDLFSFSPDTSGQWWWKSCVIEKICLFIYATGNNLSTLQKVRIRFAYILPSLDPIGITLDMFLMYLTVTQKDGIPLSETSKTSTNDQAMHISVQIYLLDATTFAVQIKFRIC